MTQNPDNRHSDIPRSSCSFIFFCCFSGTCSLARSPRVIFFLSHFWYLSGRPSFFFYFDIAHFEFFIEILVMPVADVTYIYMLKNAKSQSYCQSSLHATSNNCRRSMKFKKVLCSLEKRFSPTEILRKNN